MGIASLTGRFGNMIAPFTGTVVGIILSGTLQLHVVVQHGIMSMSAHFGGRGLLCGEMFG